MNQGDGAIPILSLASVGEMAASVFRAGSGETKNLGRPHRARESQKFGTNWLRVGQRNDERFGRSPVNDRDNHAFSPVGLRAGTQHTHPTWNNAHVTTSF